jgi:Domain of unknown function (DUF4385)
MPFKKFEYDRDFKTIDFRAHPELYQVGVGEQGVLSVNPYKSEILPHWRFKTPVIAQESARKIYKMFIAYKKDNDFVGMDMARKFLQMGYTRARRYANHASGTKYDEQGNELPRVEDPEKAEAAKIFYEVYMRAKNDPYYIVLKARHRNLYERI